MVNNPQFAKTELSCFPLRGHPKGEKGKPFFFFMLPNSWASF